jgi:hypothetical protein
MAAEARGFGLAACAACSSPVPREFWNREEGVRCQGCGQTVRLFAFPAVDRNLAGTAPELLHGETEASCFYHPQSRAAIVCAECGRFLCALCDLEVEGRHICPRCFESGVNEHKIQTAEPRRVMYDNMALALAILPALLIWPAVIGAPWALVIVFTRWNKPASVVPRTKFRFILAALFAIAELGFIAFMIYMMTQVNMKAPR